ncbi:MAG: pyruvate kinase [Patescibacteria group bacterium]|nr:pyruvate kinase [Patescibacteria group bacterium]
MRTKIVATLGPASESKEMIEKFVHAGMDIARMNFSHCSEAEYVSRAKYVKSAARKAGRPVKILQDLQGPRIRVGVLPAEGRKLEEGNTIHFRTDKKDGDGSIFIDHPRLHLDIRVGDPLYLANGEMELEVRRVTGNRIAAEVIRGGVLYSRKGVNVPRTKLSNSGLTAKDIKDVKFGLRQGVDFVAISFVQTADDIKKLRKLVGNKAKIIAKIETALALENIDAIIQASDAIMIARGDLGIEVPIERVPAIQKSLIRHASWYGKGTITATQMLLSMTDHARPTRAEVSDVANAVWDGSDAVMLSDESAGGKYPLEAVRTMHRIVAEAEKLRFERPNPLG